jgi:hypothetical protein
MIEISELNLAGLTGARKCIIINRSVAHIRF